MEPEPCRATQDAPVAAPPLLVEGRTCWRRARARRVSFVVDADAYFDVFAAAAARARRSILVVGWDFDSRTPLWRSGPGQLTPPPLGDFLTALVLVNPDLHVHVLEWDFSPLYSRGRELPPRWGLGWRHHRRIHVALDGTAPWGACHHQKVVVVDDALAFVGGLDLTRQRWDTSAHRADDPRRFLDGIAYPPFHDAVMAVDGDAAAALAALARERWLRATGQPLAPAPSGGTPWPRRLPVDLHDVDVGIARTAPPGNGGPDVREVERLHLAMIERARRLLYAENQYFTSGVLAGALAARLEDPAGPEVVLVLRHRTAGVLAGPTMDLLRTRRLERLAAADRHGRLNVVYPVLPGLGGQFINVHSKVLIADDDAVRVGSANMADRSLRVDTECDLAVESGGQPRVQRAIARFRHRLLGEHLDLPPADVARAEAQPGGVAALLRERRDRPRSLKPLPPGRPWPPALLPLAQHLCDPLVAPSPGAAARAVRRHPQARRVAMGAAAFLLAALAALLAWRFTPLAELARPDRVLALLRALRHHPAVPLVMAALYTAAMFTGFPRPLLTGAAAAAFGPVHGFLYALLGVVMSSLAAYAVGRAARARTLGRWAGPRLDEISRHLRRRAWLAMAVVHALPVAPAVVVNMVAGALGVGVAPFVVGTALGYVPGTLFSCFVGGGIGRLLTP